MDGVIVLNQREVAESLDMQSVIQAVEEAFQFKSAGKAEVYPLICKMYDNGSEFDIKSGECSGANVLGLKLAGGYPLNVPLGLPRSNGIIVIFDYQHGLLKGILDSTYITRIRTGAAGGIGAKYLARKDSKTLTLLGAGRLAPYLVAAALEAMEHIEKVILCNPRHPQRGEEAAAGIKDLLLSQFVSRYLGTEKYDAALRKINITYLAEPDVQAACGEADIIITATNAREALIKSEWIKAGTHLSCMGADMPGKQEIDEKLVARARLFADDLEQVITVGECKVAYQRQLIQRGDILEIGQVIAGNAAGRTNDEEITIFDSTGIAIQDLLAGQAAIRIADQKNIGLRISL